MGLKMLDDAGIETNLDQSLVQSLLVGGKEQKAEFDADGNLKVPVDASGAEQIVEVRLKDGQTLGCTHPPGDLKQLRVGERRLTIQSRRDYLDLAVGVEIDQ